MPKVLLPVPHYKQIGEYNCLPACARMVLAYWGQSLDENELAAQLGATAYGTTGSRLLRLQSSKFEVFFGPMSLSQVQNYLDIGVPVIALVSTIFLDYWEADFAHAVVVVGYDNEGVFLNDPAFVDAAKKASETGFLAAWGEFDFLSGVLQKR